jgi:serine/threonine protein kinase/sugar lactone lactonase YvrE
LSEESPARLAGFLAGSLLAGYRLEAQVGAGGMAVVFRARDERLGRLVALKILAPGLASDSEFRRRFIAESRAAAAVDDPHIIPVYEAGEAEGVLFIAMRFVQGGDLRQVLVREGALPPDRTAGFISPVASALDAAHRVGLVHRDVKPANVLVDAREDRPDHVYLSDFGVSKGAMSAAGLTGTGVFLGTPDYSAPEQIEGRVVDGRTDQYALACVAYQLLTGAVPFERDQGMAVLLAHLSQSAPSVVSRRPELPGAVDQVLAKAMAKIPEKRYDSCGDFADALREALGLTPYHRRGPVTAPPHPPLPATSLSEDRSLAAASIASADPSAAVDSEQGFADASDPRGATVDSLPGGGSAAVAEPPAPIVVTGPGSPGREAGDDAGTARPRWRRPHRLPARRRRGSSPTGAVAAGEGMQAAAATGLADSQPIGDLGTAVRQGEPASPQPSASTPPETPSLAAAVAVTQADAGAAVESDLSAAVEPDPGTVTVDSVPGGASAGTAEVPAAVLVTGPGLSGGEADDDDDAAAATAAAESQLTRDPVTAAGPGEPASPQPPVASPSQTPSLSAAATGTAVTPAEPASVTSGPALSATMDAASDGGPAGVAEVPATAVVTGPGRVSRETSDSARTASPTAGPDGPTDPGSDVAAATRHPQPGVVDRPGTRSGWIRRHRLGVLALVCAILGAAGALPFVLTSAPHSPARGNPPRPGSSPGSASSSIYSPVGIDLPAGYQGLVSSLAFSPSGATLAIAADGVCLWDIAAKGCIPGPRLTTAYSVAFSPDGKTLACGDDNNGSTYLWNVTAKRLLAATLPDPASEGVDSVAFNPGGSILAAADSNGSTYLWNVATGKPIGTLTDSPSKGVVSVAFSPGGSILAAGDANGSTYLWNVATRNRTGTLVDSGGKGVESVAFSPDGKILAAGDANGGIYLWNVATRNRTGTLVDSGGKGVESVAFSPDGKILAAGDANGSTYLWNVATGKPITTLTDPNSMGINSVAFSPDGMTLATADQNSRGSVYIWHIS